MNKFESSAPFKQSKVEKRWKKMKACRAVSITSGKGGVGKTFTVVNLGLSLAKEGQSVLLLDADMTLANIDVMLGLTPKRNISDFFQGRVPLESVIQRGPLGIDLLPATSGDLSLATLNPYQRIQLLDGVSSLADKYDYILVDTPAGIHDEVLFLNAASSMTVVVITPDPTSLTDSYALIKLLSSKYGEKSFSIMVNQAANPAEGKAAYLRFQSVVEKFLPVSLELIGVLPVDESARESIGRQMPVVISIPSSPVARNLEKLAEAIHSSEKGFQLKGTAQFTFQHLAETGS